MTELFVTGCGLMVAILQAYTAWQNRRNSQQILMVREAAEEAQAHAAIAAKNAAMAHDQLSGKIDQLIESAGDGLRTVSGMGNGETSQ